MVEVHARGAFELPELRHSSHLSQCCSVCCTLLDSLCRCLLVDVLIAYDRDGWKRVGDARDFDLNCDKLNFG